MRYKYNTASLIFLIAFIYIIIYTVDVPPNWESHLFIEGNANTHLIQSLKNVFLPGEDNLTGSHGPFNAVYYRLMFLSFGYNFIIYRIIKAIFFASSITFIFLLCKHFLRQRYAVAASIFILFSFPIFIQTLVFDEGFIIGETFKLAALLIFLLDIQQIQSKFLYRIIFTLFGILAIRMYTPTFSIVSICLFYLLFIHREKLKQYIFFILILIMYKFPTTLSGLHFGESSYGLKFYIINEFLFEDVLRYIISPLPVFSDLYYKPFISIITFFLFWLFIIFFIILFFQRILSAKFPRFIETKRFTRGKKSLITFLIIWILAEIPIFFILPESAIRYFAATLTPLIIIFCVIFEQIDEMICNNKKIIISIFFIIFSLGVLTNISYSTLFRATWGSSFIGFYNVGEYILATESKQVKLFHHTTSVAPEYVMVDKEKTNKYTISEEIEASNLRVEDFNYAFFEQQRGIKEVYVVKRVSSFGRSQYPEVDLNNISNLEIQKTISGRNKFLFDRITNVIIQILIIPYKPNMFYIYKLKIL